MTGDPVLLAEAKALRALAEVEALAWCDTPESVARMLSLETLQRMVANARAFYSRDST